MGHNHFWTIKSANFHRIYFTLLFSILKGIFKFSQNLYCWINVLLKIYDSITPYTNKDTEEGTGNYTTCGFRGIISSPKTKSRTREHTSIWHFCVRGVIYCTKVSYLSVHFIENSATNGLGLQKRMEGMHYKTAKQKTKLHAHPVSEYVLKHCVVFIVHKSTLHHTALTCTAD